MYSALWNALIILNVSLLYFLVVIKVIIIVMSFLRSSARQSEEKEYWRRKAKDEVLAVENEARKIKVVIYL